MIPTTALNRTFTILDPVEVQQPNGEIVTTYSGSVTFPGALIAITGNEEHDANVMRTEKRFQVVTLHRTDITAKKRLSVDSRIFQVEYERDPSERGQYMLIEVVQLG